MNAWGERSERQAGEEISRRGLITTHSVVYKLGDLKLEVLLMRSTHLHPKGRAIAIAPGNSHNLN